MTKRIIKTALIGMIMLCSCLFFIGNAYAADFSNARAIDLNQDIQDSVSKGYYDEQKLYQVTTTEDGYIAVHFSNPLQKDNNAYWNVEFYNATYRKLYSRSIYGNHADTDIIPVGLPAGTYYICVNSPAGSYAVSTDAYTINIGFTATAQWEKEVNGAFTNATSIELNSDYYGTIRDGYYDEKDFYQIELPQPGYLDVSLAHELQGDSGNYWEVTLYNSAYQKISSRLIAGNTTSSVIPTMGLDSGTYYILVTSAASSWVCSESIYTVRADFTASNVWEKEFNETFTSATQIEPDTDYYGTIRGGYYDEKDYYRVNIEADGYYRIDITTPILSDSSSYWEICLYNSSYEKLAGAYVNGNHSNHYIHGSLTVGTYYVIVTSTVGSWAKSTAVYQIKVSLEQNNTPEPEPSPEPLPEPLPTPSLIPEPTIEPTVEPTIKPTVQPTVTPTIQPTVEPTVEPTEEPTEKPTEEPTLEPTEELEISPTPDPVATERPGGDITDDNHWFEDEDDGEFDDDIFNNGDDEDEDDNEENDDSQNVGEFYNVEWNVTSVTLQVGKSTAKVKAASDNDKIVEYITSNAAVATVNSKGVITGKSVGNAIIRAITEHGCMADVRIKVQKKAVTTKKLTVKNRNIRLKIGKVYSLNAQITPITSSQRITYKSSKPKVAAVNSKGQIKAKEAGKAVITVKSGKKVIKIKVIVKK